MSTKQIQEIYQYIQSSGIFLSSQKVLKQVNKHPDLIWEMIVKLCSRLKNKNIQNAYAQMVFMLDEPEKHQRSSKWLKQYMDIKDLAIKLSTSYTVLDYIKPQRQKIIHFISKIIQVSKGLNKLREQNDQLILKDEVMTKQLNKYKMTQENISFELEELRQRKKSELPIYEQKLKICDQINKEIVYKRQEKLDLISAQKILQEQINAKQKFIEDRNYQNQTKLLNIQQLKKEVAQNAPEVKKQKRAAEDQYHKLARQFQIENQLCKHRQNALFTRVRERATYRHTLVEFAERIVQNFVNLQQQTTKFTKQKQENEQLHRKKSQLSKRQSQLRDTINQISMQLSGKNLGVQNEVRNIGKSQVDYLQKSSKILQAKQESKALKQKKRRLEEYMENIRNKIEQIREKYEKQQIQNRKTSRNWKQLVITQIEGVYSDFQVDQQETDQKKSRR